MTKEELEKEAEEKFKVNNKDKDREHFYDRMWFKTGYLAGAEPREKRIAELEQQIEKMKCDVLSVIKDRMNDDIDQNIIERLAEKWELKNE